MPLHAATKAFLQFLHQHQAIRNQVRAAPDKTLLYAGAFFKPVWREIDELKRANPQLATKQSLPDVLSRVGVPGKPFANLLAYAKDVEGQVPWKPDGFTVWRALSGIFTANAIGGVSFCVGGGVSRETKVFAATEIAVLARNPQVDPITKDVLAYYQRCLKDRQTAMNFGFISR